MCKEHGAGARCRLRKAAANQITALRCISEAVGVRSFERATTELRTDLDTPALADALKTTGRKLQIAEQRVATLEASLTQQQNLRMHGELLRAIDIPAGGAAANHSYKVFMQYCGAEREATLREPYLNANYQVQNLRQFVCELEQHSQVWRLNIVSHLRSESQLNKLERLKGDRRRIVIEVLAQRKHEREFVLGSTHNVVCDRGLDMFAAMRRGMRRTRQCRVLYFEVHGDFNAADRAANVLVSAPVSPPVRIQEERPAPSTPENLPERGLRQGVVHAKMEPEREPKVACDNSCVRVAPRMNVVKQQQDWMLVFVDRPETYQITNCLDEILFGEDIGYDFDLLSRSICASGGGCSSEVSHEVRLRKVQTGPELGMASLAQRIAEEEVSSDSECSRCPGDDERCKFFHEGSQERNRRRELRRAHLSLLAAGWASTDVRCSMTDSLLRLTSRILRVGCQR